MKRIPLFTLVLALFLTISTSVIAADNTYELSELGLKVTAPTGFSVITRDTPANDPVFSKYGTTKEAIIEQFEAGNVYFNALSDTHNEEIVVTMAENIISNFSLFSDTMLNTLTDTLISELDQYGIQVSKYDIYQHSQAKFVRVYFNDAANTVHGLLYYTVYDGKTINFTMRSYEGSLSSRQESTIKEVVDSVDFSSPPLVPESGEDTKAFEYTDAKTGVTFTVPANWKQEALTKDREYIDVKFLSTKDEGCMIAFGSKDIWNEMTASEKVGYSRSDFDNSVFTKADIAEMYGTMGKEVSSVTYNGVQYYRIVATYSTNVYGQDVFTTVTQLIYINNGWMYQFQFSGTSEHSLYSDFEGLLNSVEYPFVPNESEIKDFVDRALSASDSDDTDDISAIIIVSVIIAAVVIVVLIIRRRREVLNVAVVNNSTCNAPTPISSNTPTSMGFCRKCGQALPPDSEFCHICGTRINKEEIIQ